MRHMEISLMANMVRMVRRNFRICLALMPEFTQLGRRMEYRTGMG